jgi:O-antigen ligase
LGLLAWLTLSPRLRTALLGSVCIAGLLIVATQWERLHSFSGGRSADASRDSASMRLSFAYVSWQMFKDHPLVGCGFGQYYREKDAYLVDRSTSLSLEHIRHEAHHNLFLSILVETGLVGLTLYLAVLGTWAVGAWRLWTASPPNEWLRSHGLVTLATLAAYVPNALFQPMGHMNIAHMLFFFLGGVTAGLQHHVAPVITSTGPRHRVRETRAQAPVVAQA